MYKKGRPQLFTINFQIHISELIQLILVIRSVLYNIIVNSMKEILFISSWLDVLSTEHRQYVNLKFSAMKGLRININLYVNICNVFTFTMLVTYMLLLQFPMFLRVSHKNYPLVLFNAYNVAINVSNNCTFIYKRFLLIFINSYIKNIT